MHVEVSVALNFVMTYLYNKLPRRRVDMFGDELEKALKKKFEGHWYPETPFKGSAFRCCRLTGEQADPVMDVAALASGLDVEEIREYLPEDLVVWIDPCEVSYRIGEKGVVKVLYSTREEASSLMGLDREVQAANKGFNPEAQCFKPIDSLSSSLSNLSLSPSSPPNAVSPLGVSSFTSASPLGYMGRQPATPMMTTAMFAQTKFGSTKLKTQIKRPARLSPTELGAYLNQRHVLPPPASFPILPPQAMRPREPRRDMLDQQRLIFAQHYGNPGLMNSLGNSPLGGSLNDLYGQHQQPATSLTPSFPDLRQPPAPRAPLQQGPPSPEANQAFLDALNKGTIPPYASLQHLLVAN